MTISEETLRTIETAEPNPSEKPPVFASEDGFTLNAPETAPGATPGAKRKGGRGNRGPNYERNQKKKGKAPTLAAEPEPAAAAAPAETPKTLVRGCKWILRNTVTMMKEGYGWDEPEDYNEWLDEAAPLAANVIQKHFPTWFERWGDEILLLAILLCWITPNVGKELRKRPKPIGGHGGPEGQREDNKTLQLAQSA